MLSSTRPRRLWDTGTESGAPVAIDEAPDFDPLHVVERHELDVILAQSYHFGPNAVRHAAE